MAEQRSPRVVLARVLVRASRRLDAAQAKLNGADTRLQKAVARERARNAAENAARAKRESAKRESAKQERAKREAAAASRRDLADRRAQLLAVFYDRIRAYTAVAPDRDAHGRPTLPPAARIGAVQRAALSHAASEQYFRSLLTHEDPARASIDAVRAMISANHRQRARAFAQLLRSRPDSAAVGDVAMALVADIEDAPEAAWAFYRRAGRAAALRLAPADYTRTAYRFDPAAALAAISELLTVPDGTSPSAAEWLALAQVAFLGGAEELSQRAMKYARAEADPALVLEIDWLESWLGRAAAAREQLAAPIGAVPFAVLDYMQPERTRTSSNLGDHLQTVASLGHLARRSGLRFVGEPQLVELVEELAARVAPERRIEGDDAELALYRVDRDSSSWNAVPDGTWMLVFGWYMRPQFGLTFDFPLNPRLRPIYLSFHIHRPSMLSPAAVEHLRRYGPIGCRDWYTTHLLLAAGVPAFFSGCLTTTIDHVAGSDGRERLDRVVHVDAPPGKPDKRSDVLSQVSAVVWDRGFADNARAALARLEHYAGYGKVVTSRLHTYVPARAIGADVEFRPKNPVDSRFGGLAAISDEAFEEMRRGVNAKLDAVLQAVAAGKSVDDVFALWRELCAPDVATAQAHRELPELPPPSLDVAAACAAVRARSVTVERTAPAPEGTEIAIEFSLDGNLRHHLAVVLESILGAASRPICAYVLSRDHGPADHDRMARFFPSVRFVWLPTDEVDYGPILGMLSHITVATMDRLLLPELLPEVLRILHLDLDLIVDADIAGLFDVDLGGHPLAARSSLQRHYHSGFTGLLLTTKRHAERPELAWELTARTHTRHRFDFEGFNAGVLVLDLDRLRADGFCRHFLPYVERFGLNDQEVLNAYAGSDHVILDPRWNTFARLEPADSAWIVHWAGSPKPWRGEYVQRRDLWRAVEARLAVRVGASGPPDASS